jgi:RND family efflux transporter MFP subunit
MKGEAMNRRGGGSSPKRRGWLAAVAAALLVALAGSLSSCGGNASQVEANAPTATVAVTRVVKKSLGRQITLSSELVPFQEIDVFAKESGYVKKLYVDYGSHVKEGQVMATLEIPELEAQLEVDQADIKNANDEVTRAQHELSRYQALYKALHLEYTRLNGVFESQPGIVAQQEVDDAQGKDLAAASQVDAGEAALAAAESNLAAAKARLVREQSLFDYSRITAPFSGVVTDRYANLGTLVQAGVGTSTQAIPIVRLSQDDLFRLVIPVPESYVQFIRIGDPVDVRVPSLNHTFPGKVARFSVDVRVDTRTMHTEVDVRNPNHVLVPGLYAEATLTLEHRNDIPTVPIQALNHETDKTTVFVVDRDGTLRDRQVQTGLTTSNYAEIVSGLEEGEQVVVGDRSGLRDGERVQAKMVPVLEYHDSNSQ